MKPDAHSLEQDTEQFAGPVEAPVIPVKVVDHSALDESDTHLNNPEQLMSHVDERVNKKKALLVNDLGLERVSEESEDYDDDTAIQPKRPDSASSMASVSAVIVKVEDIDDTKEMGPGLDHDTSSDLLNGMARNKQRRSDQMKTKSQSKMNTSQNLVSIAEYSDDDAYSDSEKEDDRPRINRRKKLIRKASSSGSSDSSGPRIKKIKPAFDAQGAKAKKNIGFIEEEIPASSRLSNRKGSDQLESKSSSRPKVATGLTKQVPPIKGSSGTSESSEQVVPAVNGSGGSDELSKKKKSGVNLFQTKEEKARKARRMRDDMIASRPKASTRYRESNKQGQMIQKDADDDSDFESASDVDSHSRRPRHATGSPQKSRRSDLDSDRTLVSEIESGFNVRHARNSGAKQRSINIFKKKSKKK